MLKPLIKLNSGVTAYNVAQEQIVKISSNRFNLKDQNEQQNIQQQYCTLKRLKPSTEIRVLAVNESLFKANYI